MDDFSVLLVDDEEDFLTLLARRLRRRHYVVRCVGTGAEALDELSQRFADLVVLDVRLPGMGGIETLRRIKTDHPEVQVIMLTGFVDPRLAYQARELGAVGFLTKPVKLQELLDHIDQAVVRSQGRRTAAQGEDDER